ncbi:unnamed protein product [Closterium sp. Yama58-4]|nr:unnamed protein product [Closterium sp. Yama58-4]
MAEEDEMGRLKALQGAVGLGSFNARRAAQRRGALSAAGAALRAVSAVSAVSAVDTIGWVRSTPVVARAAAVREEKEMAALREWLDEAGVGRGGEEPPACSPPFSPTAPFPAFQPSPAVDSCSGGSSTGKSEGSGKGSSHGGSRGSSRVNGKASGADGGIGSSGASSNGEMSSFISGSGSGRRRAKVRRVKAHRGPVVAVALAEHAESHELLLTTAGADGMVKSSSSTAEHAESHDLLLTSAGADGMVKVVCVRRVKAHRGPVVAVALAEHAESHDLLLTTAGADGMVKVRGALMAYSEGTSWRVVFVVWKGLVVEADGMVKVRVLMACGCYR